MKIAAIVLAAGLSKRMGSINKMLYEVEGEPMLLRTIRQLLQSKVNRVIVVLGHQAELVKAQLEIDHPSLEYVMNTDFERGMSTSIARGAQALQSESGCFICLGDMPFITTDEYNLMRDAFINHQNTSQIVLPVFHGKTGNPILFGQRYFQNLCNLKPNDQGAKPIVLEHQNDQLLVQMSSDHIFRDIDKPLNPNESG